MKKILILLAVCSASAFSQAGMPPIFTEFYECQSTKVEEHRITIYRDSISKQDYTAMYFDNDSDIQLKCTTERGQINGNQKFISCYKRINNREVLVDFSFSRRSMILQGSLVETWNSGGDDWESSFRCKPATR